MSKCLFITWDGPQVSYLEGLFLPIFEGLAEHGHQFHVLQFTWGSSKRVASTEALCRAANIPYRSVTINRRLGPIGPLLSAVLGARHIRAAVRDWGIDTLMPRSLMPALATLSIRDRKGLRIIFDADGFAVDERADFQGLSRSSLTYRILKWVERRMVSLADSVMVRTTRAADILRADARVTADRFHVVTNGRDPHAYDGDRALRSDNSLRLCYAGSIGAQYLPDQMLGIARSLREAVPETTLELFTGDTQNALRALERTNLVDAEWIAISQVQPQAIPSALKSCDLALALRKKCYSTQGVAPIKIGEYLMAGMPIIGTAGVGEVEPLIEAGLMFPFDGDDAAAIQWVIAKFLPNKVHLAYEARRLGTELFGIESSVRGYTAAIQYARLAKGR